jgi:hypothetical protein
MSEQQTQQQIRLALGRGNVRLFRNNVGTGWAGQATKIQRRGMVAVEPGDVIVRQGRPVQFGLCKGSSDLIGLRSITIGPEHVGTTMAVFAAVEVKSPTGRLTAEQQSFIDTVQSMGGMSGIARSVDDARSILRLP